MFAKRAGSVWCMMSWLTRRKQQAAEIAHLVLREVLEMRRELELEPVIT